jgi:hypothetical protein
MKIQFRNLRGQFTTSRPANMNCPPGRSDRSSMLHASLVGLAWKAAQKLGCPGQTRHWANLAQMKAIPPSQTIVIWTKAGVTCSTLVEQHCIK